MNVIDCGQKSILIADEPVVETLLPQMDHLPIVDHLCRMAFQVLHNVTEVVKGWVVTVFTLSLDLLVAESGKIGFRWLNQPMKVVGHDYPGVDAKTEFLTVESEIG